LQWVQNRTGEKMAWIIERLGVYKMPTFSYRSVALRIRPITASS